MGKRKADDKKFKSVALEDQLAADAAPRQRDRKKAKMPDNEPSEELSVITLAKKDVRLAHEMRSDSESDADDHQYVYIIQSCCLKFHV